MLHEIPLTRPDTPLLDTVSLPADLRRLDREQLEPLAEEMRAFLLWTVGQTGGHFGAGLGVVELTIALHYIYDTPADRLVWDVGHQTYPHKILTGRKDRMHTMRQADGLSGFPKRSESEYDTFGVGHSSTSISAAMGMALGLANAGDERKVCAVIGDGAMTGGMAIEALAHAGHVRPNMLVVLNDNQMSIGHNSGGLAAYFAKMWSSKTYISLREGGKSVLKRMPPAWDLAKRTEEHMKGMVAPGTLFEELGWHYIGPIDGHDLPQLLQTIENMRTLDGPQLLHIQTRKGRGFEPAESDQVGYHAINKVDPEPLKPTVAEEEAVEPPANNKKPKYQQVFGDWLCDMALLDERLIGITPAMCEGSGMVEFAQRFPERYHDVAIAEQHAVTLGAGIACEGGKPVVAIYSTFLQRGYDQLVHDVALQNLDVTFGIDRAGLVGEDGATHAGSFDLTYMRCLPNMLIAAPSDENECRQLLYTCYQHEGPAAVRYPRGTGPGAEIKKEMKRLPIGEAAEKRAGQGVAFLNFGVLLPAVMSAAETLNATVVDMRWVKPLDEAKILELAESHDMLVTVEDNAVAGGVGSAVNELLVRENRLPRLLNLGLPDSFVDHGKRELQLEWIGLDAAGIVNAVNARMASPRSSQPIRPAEAGL
ncbi:MAG: 1-deoxy-D-xylulose-5-phosphate synthase [Halieaceae bacterium]|nr:1-deoxy-D-xylulose-5-phosphate synthase [Halieaceae bacterium]